MRRLLFDGAQVEVGSIPLESVGGPPALTLDLGPATVETGGGLEAVAVLTLGAADVETSGAVQLVGVVQLAAGEAQAEGVAPGVVGVLSLAAESVEADGGVAHVAILGLGSAGVETDGGLAHVVALSLAAGSVDAAGNLSAVETHALPAGAVETDGAVTHVGITALASGTVEAGGEDLALVSLLELAAAAALLEGELEVVGVLPVGGRRRPWGRGDRIDPGRSSLSCAWPVDARGSAHRSGEPRARAGADSGGKHGASPVEP